MASRDRYPLLRTLDKIRPLPRFPVISRIKHEMVLADFKTAEKKFAGEGIETQEIKDYFAHFKELKPRIQDAKQKDIDQWAKQGWAAFKGFVDELKGTKSKNQLKKSGHEFVGQQIDGAELVAENGDWWVYRITSHKAARIVGSKTAWCIVANQSHWDNYSKKSNFYFIISEAPRDKPWNKIALQVNKKTGEKTYWDETDASHDSLPKDLNVPKFSVSTQDTIAINNKSYKGEEFAAAKGLVVKGDLNLKDTDASLPEDLTVSGVLTLSPGTEELPKGLKVGSLVMRRVPVENLPEDIQITNSLDAELSGLRNIPPLKLKGDLTISGTSIRALPAGLVVGGELDLMDTALEYGGISEDVKVGGAIFVDDPDNLDFEIPKHLEEQVC